MITHKTTHLPRHILYVSQEKKYQTMDISYTDPPCVMDHSWTSLGYDIIF